MEDPLWVASSGPSSNEEAPIEASDQRLLAILRELEASTTDLSLIAIDDAAAIARLRSSLRRGDSVTDLLAFPALVSSRFKLNRGVTRVEKGLRSMLHVLYVSARDSGLSFTAIARTWGISRQLVARSFGEKP